MRQSGRVRSEVDIAETIVRFKDGSPVWWSGSGGCSRRDPKQGKREKGTPAVVLSVQKSPGTNTLNLTRRSTGAGSGGAALPAGRF